MRMATPSFSSTRGSTPQRGPRLRRRDAHRLTASAGALAGGLAGLAPVLGGLSPVAGAALLGPAPLVPLAAVDAAGAFGLNESFRAAPFGQASGASWTRWTVQWFNVQPQPGDLNVHYFRDDRGQNTLEETVRGGTKVAAMVLGTPEWAAETPGLKTGTSVPRGLYAPVFIDGQVNPENTWGAFMYQLAGSYKGLMDVFEIWNEPEIPATGSAAIYSTWSGSPEQYYQLLKVASVAARAANPDVKIVTAPYSYFKDKEEAKGSAVPWFDAFAGAVRADPMGASVFDVFALNLYRNAHDLWDRMHGGAPQATEQADRTGFRERLQSIGAGDKPVWLTEINSMPYDDEVPGWSPVVKYDFFRITMEEQASYVLQAYAVALTAGYERVFFQAAQDDAYPVPDELWGLVRYDADRRNADPSRIRPAYVAYQLAAKYMGNADWSRLYVKTRPDPRNQKQYASRFDWAGHMAVFQKGAQRTYVLWNGTEQPMNVDLPPWGVEAKVVDKHGSEAPLAPSGGRLTVTLPAATTHFQHPVFGSDPQGYFYVGGAPLLLVEEGVPGDAPVEVPGFAPA